MIKQQKHYVSDSGQEYSYNVYCQCGNMTMHLQRDCRGQQFLLPCWRIDYKSNRMKFSYYWYFTSINQYHCLTSPSHYYYLVIWNDMHFWIIDSKMKNGQLGNHYHTILSTTISLCNVGRLRWTYLVYVQSDREG